MKKVVHNIRDFLNNNWGIIAIALTCFIVLIPLLFVGNIPKSHDIHFHMSRILGIKDMMAIGDYKALIHGTFFGGYGYANGLFYSNFFLYLPATLCLFGMDIFTSYKILIILCTALTACSMYFCVKKITLSKIASIVSSIIYVAAPYRVIDVYQRGALGEVLAFIFVPFVILGLYELIYRDYKKWWYLVIGFSGLLLSHLISFTIIVIVSLIFILFNIKKFVDKPQKVLFLCIAGFITILLTAFFLFPMLEQLMVSDFVLNNVTVNWDIGARAMPLGNIFLGINLYAFPCGIGLIFILISLLFFKVLKDKSSLYKFCRSSLFTGFILLLVTTSLFPWDFAATWFASFQFPWRFLLPAVAFLSISSGIIMDHVLKEIKENKIIIVGLIIAISIMAPISIMNTEYENKKQINFNSYGIGYGEYLPYKTQYKELIKRGNIITTDKPMTFTYAKKGTTMTINYETKVASNYMEVPLLYYYGYKAVDLDSNKEVKIEAGTNNVIRVYLESIGSGKIKIYYEGTFMQHFSLVLSIISLLSLVGYCLYKVTKKWVYFKKQSI